MDVIDYFQAINGNVAGVNAPLLVNYPSGYVDSGLVPMALTWPISDTLDDTGSSLKGLVHIDVLVSPLAQGNFPAIKAACRDLRDLFITEYADLTGDWLSNDPPVRIVPGTIDFGGYRNTVLAPDETPFHGFQITMQTEVHINADCD